MAKHEGEAADHVSVSCCKHGTLHINLHRADGTIYAVAMMPEATAIQFNRDTAAVMASFAAGHGYDCGGSLH